MYIKGCIPFSNKKERLAAWKELKQEFGDRVKIIFLDGFLSYSAKVDRTYYM